MFLKSDASIVPGHSANGSKSHVASQLVLWEILLPLSVSAIVESFQ